MRTVSEILEVAKSGGEWPTHEECFWAMQALEQAWISTSSKYREHVYKPKWEQLAHALCESNFQMGKSLMATDPKTWLGPDRDYSRPENRERREVALKLFNKALNGELPTQQKAKDA